MRRLTRIVVLGGVLGIATPAVGVASTHPAMGLADLLKRADVGFVGKVSSVQEEEVSDKRIAFTHVAFAVKRLIFQKPGLNVTDEITLVFAGGKVADGEFRVAGLPTFAIGDEVIAFAFHDGRRYADPIVGGPQGLFRVVRDPSTDVAYPLADGRRGIERVFKGNLVATQRIGSIAAGKIVYEEATLLAGAQVVSAPTPVAGSGAAVTSSVTAERRPAKILDVEAFVAAVVDARKQLAVRER